MKKLTTGLMALVISLGMGFAFGVNFLLLGSQNPGDPLIDEEENNDIIKKTPDPEKEEPDPGKQDPEVPEKEDPEVPEKEDPEVPEKEDPEDPGKEDPEVPEKEDPISATIDFHPKRLNLKSKGKWVTVFIKLPEEYDVNDIDLATILLNSELAAELTPTEIIDIDNDGLLDLMVKFNRTSIKDVLNLQAICEITITGTLFSGIEFISICQINLINYTEV